MAVDLDAVILHGDQLKSFKNLTARTAALSTELSNIKKMLPHRLKKMLKGGTEYYQYYSANSEGLFELQKDLKDPIFNIDGHPSFTKDGRYMITDSYPDKNKFQRLIVYNMSTNKGVIIGKFYAPLKGNPASCDLHPKLCRNNNYLVADSAYTGRHRMVMFELNWDLIKEKIG